MIWKSTFREIKSSLGRFCAILAIVALGVGFFAGLKVAKAAMVRTTGQYLEEQGFYDYRLLSTLGFEQEDVEYLREQEDVKAAEGAVSFDILYQDGTGNEGVVKAHSITENVNQLKLLSGRMPENASECVVDSNLFDDSCVGQILKLSGNNAEEDLEHFAYGEYTIVGIVQSSYYIQYERGNTSLGTGKINGFIYLPLEGFDTDYYTEIFVKFEQSFPLYSEEYEDFLEEKETLWEAYTLEAADMRYERILEDAYRELADAREEFEEEKADAEAELQDAADQLKDAEEQLADGEQQLADARQELADARQTVAEKEQELADGEQEIAQKEQELADGEQTLAEGIETWNVNKYKLDQAKGQLAAGESQLAEQKAVLEEKESLLTAGETELNDTEAALNLQKQELDAKEQELNAQQQQLDGQEQQLDAKEQELDAQEQRLSAQEQELDEREQDLDAQEQQLRDLYGEGNIPEQLAEQIATGREQIATGREEIAQGREQIATGKGQIAAGREQIATGKEQIATGREQIAAGSLQIEGALSQIAEKRQELEAGRTALAEGKEVIAAYEQELAAGSRQIKDGDKALADAWQQIEDARQELADGRTALEDAREQLADGRNKLTDAGKDITEGEQTLAGKEAELADARTEYEDGLKEYEEGVEEFNEKIADAGQKLDDAEQEIEDIKAPDTYVLGRDTNVGYVCFENDSAIVEGIANIFPVFFFLVAALVCVTTMNRMVEEQRTQIGVLKALGYKESVIMSKYMFYSGSAAVLGCVTGFAGGTYLFPRVIWTSYSIMYRLDSLLYVFDWKLAVISLAVSILCSVGTTWLSCRVELAQVAAQLMRPRAPKAGKRVFLEYLPFLWKRLGFLRKVSIRNIFRYKKRLIMMVMGISGCTALLVTGFGIRDSIANVAVQQFSEIQTYDLNVAFAEGVTDEDGEALQNAAGIDDGQYAFVYETAFDLVTEEGRKSVNLIVLDSDADMTPFLNLHTKEKEQIAYPAQGEVVITDKIADTYGLHVGDTITLQDENRKTIFAEISGISQNFIYNYAYINNETYRECMGQDAEYKNAYVNIPEEADAHLVSAALMKCDGVAGVSVNLDTLERFSGMMQSLNLIVIFVIFCAAGLAFIVLYNLTNINITERVREIATIKVLGFHKNETSSYVFRENAVLVIMGAAVGMVLGHYLHLFVMNEINIDLIAFDIHVLPVSFLYSVLLTFAFAWIVDRIMGRKLERISMTESLKSVD